MKERKRLGIWGMGYPWRRGVEEQKGIKMGKRPDLGAGTSEGWKKGGSASGGSGHAGTRKCRWTEQQVEQCLIAVPKINLTGTNLPETRGQVNLGETASGLPTEICTGQDGNDGFQPDGNQLISRAC